MKFQRIKNPRAALILIPWFVEANETREEIYLELRDRLTYQPDETFVCVATENDQIHSWIAAYTEPDCVWVWQLRARTDFTQQEQMASLFYAWVREKGHDTIRGGNLLEKVKKYYIRRYGYVDKGEYIEKKLQVESNIAV